MAQQNGDPINALPEYEVRTMKDDLNKLEGKAIEPKLVNLKAPEKPKTYGPPEELPIITEIKEAPKPKIEPPSKQSLSEEIDNILNVPTPKIVAQKPIKEVNIKSPLPSIEDFIVPAPPPKPLPKAIPVPAPIPLSAEAPARAKAEIPVPLAPISKIVTKETQEDNDENDEIERTIKAHKTKKLLTILGIIAVIVIVVNITGYLIITKIKSPEPTPPPTNDQPEISASLIKVDETKIFKIENNVSLIDLLINEEGSAQLEKTLKRIVPTKISGDFLSLNELTQELQIYVPPYTLAELKNNYTLVVYKQGDQQRIGLIVEIKNLDNFIEKSKSWEKTMPWNFQGMFLNHQPNNLTTNGFSDNKYNGINVRIVDLPIPELSLDHTIKNNLFLMSTSRESIYSIIDRLK